MKATEFAYWLQGYFELNGGANSLTEAQAKAVYKKAKSVEAVQGDVEQKAQYFVERTKGVLFAADGGFVGDHPSYLAAATENIRTRLNDLFLHAIDPSIPGDQNIHKRAHRPDPPKDGRLEVMC